ncbi:MAG: hypothetical protein AAB421_04530 [Patescibacteria group bacterium]
MSLTVPNNCRRVLFQFILPGSLFGKTFPAFADDLGVETPEQAETRQEKLRAHPGTKLISIESGLVTGRNFIGRVGDDGSMEFASSPNAQPDPMTVLMDASFKLARVKVQERGERLGHIVISFVFGRNEDTWKHPVGTRQEAVAWFMDLLENGWGQVAAYRNPMVRDDVVVPDVTEFAVRLARKANSFPKHYEFGDEVGLGLRAVTNTTRAVKDAARAKASAAD